MNQHLAIEGKQFIHRLNNNLMTVMYQAEIALAMLQNSSKTEAVMAKILNIQHTCDEIKELVLTFQNSTPS